MANIHSQLRITTMVLAVSLIFGIFFTVNASNYKLGKNTGPAECLFATIFLIDYTDSSLQYEKLIAFTMDIDTGVLPEALGETWLKRLVAKPGDHVRVTPSNVRVTYQDGTYKDYPMLAHRLAEAIDWDITALFAEYEISEGEMFVIGETEGSFDSRFWGPMKTANIVGTAYAII